jgi:hypothetical protein
LVALTAAHARSVLPLMVTASMQRVWGHAAWARLWQIARKWSKRANLTQDNRILARYTAGASTQIDPDGDRCTPGLSCVQARALQCLHRDATTFILNIPAWPNLIRNAAVDQNRAASSSLRSRRSGRLDNGDVGAVRPGRWCAASKDAFSLRCTNDGGEASASSHEAEGRVCTTTNGPTRLVRLTPYRISS